MKHKLDIVYIWVDGTDPVWRKKREFSKNLIKNQEDLELHANVEGRFRNNGELKYSIRSVEKHFPDHGNIYVITDNQTPDFLKNNSNIKILSHDYVMKSQKIQTFSSKNIESYIPFLPEISENFLYFNDDVFLGPDFCIEDFYSTKPVYYFTKNFLSQEPLISEKILSNTYLDYLITKTYSSHTPKMVSKRDFILMAGEFENLFQDTQQEVFRMKHNISFLADFFPRWMIYHKKGIIGTKQDAYFRTSEEINYQELKLSFQNIFSFCINDTSDDVQNNHNSLLQIQKTLDYLYPEKSSFER